MNSKNFSEAMNKLEDKYITEAITYNHMSKTGTRRHIKKVFNCCTYRSSLAAVRCCICNNYPFLLNDHRKHDPILVYRCWRSGF